MTTSQRTSAPIIEKTIENSASLASALTREADVLDDAQRCQFKGSRLASALLRLFGWQVIFKGLPAKQGLIVAYPHTSNWDFVVGILGKWAMGVPLHFWGKDSLFRVPLFGTWLRWVGGLPIARSSPQGVVEDMAAQFTAMKIKNEYMWLALAPEGTRKLVPGWRSGFYRVAVAADIPVGVASLDWGKRCIRITEFVSLSGDEAVDMQAIARVYEENYGGVVGKNTASASPLVLISKAPNLHGRVR
jgi:Acyltransferase